MEIQLECSECGAQSNGVGLKHAETCSANNFSTKPSTDYLRLPATTVTYDTPEQHAARLRDMSKTYAGTQDPAKATPTTPQDIPIELRIQLCYWYYKGNGQTYFDANMANAAFNGDKRLQKLEQIIYQSNKEARIDQVKQDLDSSYDSMRELLAELEEKV